MIDVFIKILVYFFDSLIMMGILIFSGIPIPSAFLLGFLGALIYTECFERIEYMNFGDD